MSRETAQLHHIGKALQSLVVAFGTPPALRDGNATAGDLQGTYFEALRDLTPAQIEAATRAAIQTSSYFPRPAELRALAPEIQRTVPKLPPLSPGELLEADARLAALIEKYTPPRRAAQ